MPLPTTNEIIAAVKTTISGVINKDFPVISDFAERQLKLMADQAVFIAKATVEGEFAGENSDLRDHFLTALAEMAKNFARVITGLVLLTIEKIWNALVGLLWDTLDKATGLVLPRPNFGNP